jgi:hypothetical protein
LLNAASSSLGNQFAYRVSSLALYMLEDWAMLIAGESGGVMDFSFARNPGIQFPGITCAADCVRQRVYNQHREKSHIAHGSNYGGTVNSTEQTFADLRLGAYTKSMQGWSLCTWLAFESNR